MKTAVEHLSNLIRIPSVSALSNRPVVDYAAMALHTTGWSTREITYRDENDQEKVNLIAAPSAKDIDDPACDLAFVCHTDTVPYGVEWSNAVDPIVTDGMVHGCGACDVKGVLACLLTAISGCEPAKLASGLRLVLTADEEIGCIGAARLVEKGALRPKRMVIGEPTSLQPARAGKGYCLAEIIVSGKKAHSAHPEEGASAIYSATRLISSVEELGANLERHKHDFFSPGFTTLNIGTIHGGTAKNIVPDECRFQMEWRPIPGQSPNEVPDAVSTMIASFKRSIPGFDAEIRVLRLQTGFETRADSTLVQVVEALTGNQAVSIPFVSEASIFAPIAGDVLVFRPGDMRTAHSSRECVLIDELNEAVNCLSSLMCWS